MPDKYSDTPELREMYPDACRLHSVCCDSVPYDVFKNECLQGKNRCSKYQMVVIDLLDDLLGELRSLDVPRRGERINAVFQAADLHE